MLSQPVAGLNMIVSLGRRVADGGSLLCREETALRAGQADEGTFDFDIGTGDHKRSTL